jgi:hypothetical protein
MTEPAPSDPPKTTQHWVAELYGKEFSIEEIAEVLSISTRRVYYVLKKLDLLRDRRFQTRARLATRLAEIEQARAEGKPWSVIAAQLKVTSDTLRGFIRSINAEIPLCPTGEHKIWVDLHVQEGLDPHEIAARRAVSVDGVYLVLHNYRVLRSPREQIHAVYERQRKKR